MDFLRISKLRFMPGNERQGDIVTGRPQPALE